MIRISYIQLPVTRVYSAIGQVCLGQIVQGYVVGRVLTAARDAWHSTSYESVDEYSRAKRWLYLQGIHIQRGEQVQ